jgi:hypothetical protein
MHDVISMNRSRQRKENAYLEIGLKELMVFTENALLSRAWLLHISSTDSEVQKHKVSDIQYFHI